MKKQRHPTTGRYASVTMLNPGDHAMAHKHGKKKHHKKTRKNPAESGSQSMGKRVLYTTGAVLGSVAVTAAATYGLGQTSLSANAQDAILAGGGVALGAGAKLAKLPRLGIGLMTGPAAVAGTRTALRLAIGERVQAAVRSATGQSTPATTPTQQIPAPQPTPAAGYPMPQYAARAG